MIMKLALEADRVFTGRSDGAEKAVVLIDDDRIVSVDTWLADDTVPVMRLPGTTLLSGLIDAHTHVSVLPACGNQIDQMKRPVEEQLAAARANVLADLTSGVTTMRIMGQELDVDFRLRDEIAGGRSLGPDLVCAGVQLAKPGGHGHALTSVSTVDDIKRLVNANASRGAGLIKIFTTGGVSSVASSQGDCPFTDREIRTAADAAHRHGLKLASHAHGGVGAKLAIENGVDTIEHGALLDERLIEEAARRGLAIVGTFSIAEHPAGVEAGDASRPEIIAKLREVRTRIGETWRRILQSGVDVALGTDSMHGCLAFDVTRLTAFGATPARAIRAVTRDAATVCGLTDRGTIAPGLRADLIAVLGNPLDDVRSLACPVLVIKAGRIVHRLGV
ncbi:MAG TPA: amidohydrolase family protein [Vicinamibacterales bacterium]|jgi:imidazolonepropionase-like amidohydrolase|nr:amidohydrolase family protein [Vicinamibacterales bacterium]